MYTPEGLDSPSLMALLAEAYLSSLLGWLCSLLVFQQILHVPGISHFLGSP
jgi:hypothetical protein